MLNDSIKTNILSARIIPQADPGLLSALSAPKGAGSLGLFTSDSDDVSYAALDEATKKADVRIVYAKSMYAGSGNASTRLAGEFIGVLAGPGPEDVSSGLDAALAFANDEASFFSAADDDSIIYFAHCISRTGSYLSATAGIAPGAPLAYLIAPPLEAMYALDAALKVADVEMRLFYGPPTETNFAGGLLTGDQAACRAACDEFARVVREVAQNPIDFMGKNA